MHSWITHLVQHCKDFADSTRLFLAVVVSLALHAAILMLQFGEYGDGMPGFGLLLGDRRARTPELQLNLQRPASTSLNLHSTEPDASVHPVKPLATETNVPPGDTGFVLVPHHSSITAPVSTATVKKSFSKKRIGIRRPTAKLLTSDIDNSAFKVAVPDAGKPDLSMTEMENTSTPQTAVPDALANEVYDRSAEAKAAEERLTEETQLQGKMDMAVAAAEDQKKLKELELAKLKLVEKQKEQDSELEIRRNVQLVQQQSEKRKQDESNRKLALAAEELEIQRRAQLIVQQNEKFQLAKLAKRQEESEAAELEKTRLALQAERVAAEQGRLAEEARTEKMNKDQADRQQQLREQQAEKARVEQQVRLIAEQKEAQLAEQLKNRRREIELQAQAAQAQLREFENEKAELIGRQNVALGAIEGKDVQNGSDRPALDKLLGGRTFDFDKNGDAVKASQGTAAPTPRFEAASGAKRSVFGSKNGDVDLSLYVKTWRQKIERNGSLNYSQLSKDRMHTDPVVTVSIRSDGSVENIIILRSSGRPDMDEAIRRIITVNTPYSVFPPGLARKFDVVDIRQIWIFDESLRITDEIH